MLTDEDVQKLLQSLKDLAEYVEKDAGTSAPGTLQAAVRSIRDLANKIGSPGSKPFTIG